MGRELTDIHMDKKPNGIVTKPNCATPEKVQVVPKISEDENEEKEYEVKECTVENSVVENRHENFGGEVTEGSIEKPGSPKSTSPVSLATGKRASGTSQHTGVETAADGNNMQTPKKTSQVTESNVMYFTHNG